MSEQKIESIEVKKDKIIVTASIPMEDFERRPLYNYEFTSDLKKQLQTLLAEKIWKEDGEKIMKDVLLEVNWPEVVRSEIAQKVIKEIAKSY